MDNRNLRERTESAERATLSTWATLSAESKGRVRYEEPDEQRTAFAVDRDRILAAPAFRALGRTSFAVGGPTRLEVTLEVARAARVLANALRANTDLVEAIALAHDLGGPPYGEAGAEAVALTLDAELDEATQSARALDGDPDANPSWEVIDGVASARGGTAPATLEGGCVRVARRAVVLARRTEVGLAAGVSRGALSRAFGHEVRRGADIVEVVVRTAVAESVDRPDVVLGAEQTAALDEVEALLDTRPREDHGRRARAVHVLSSLLVADLADGVDADAAVDALCARTDEESRRAFLQRFTPEGA